MFWNRLEGYCSLSSTRFSKKILCRKYTDKNGGGSPVAIAPSSSVDALSLTQRQREMGKTQFHS